MDVPRETRVTRRIAGKHDDVVTRDSAGKAFAQRLRSLRGGLHLSQQELADKLDPNPGYARARGSKTGKARVSKYENGYQVPTDETVAMYAALAGVDEDDLLELARRARAERQRPGRPRRPTASDVPADPSAPPRERETGSDTHRHRVWYAVAGVMVPAAVVTGVALTRSDGAAKPQLSRLYVRDGGRIALRTCPNTGCRATYLPTDTRVRMICFRDAQDVAVNYPSPRWFNVRDPRSGAHGWVHSSEVGEQSRVGAC